MSLKHLILPLLILAGILLHQSHITDWHYLLEIIDRFAHHWWVWALVLGMKVVFYALAMPGSSLIWIAAILYKPVQATLLIIGGGTFGGLAGYFLSRKISQRGKTEKKDSVFVGFLQKNSHFLALCAVRMIPGFPHSAINYGAGILDIPWFRFLLATVVGFAVKGFVYASAIHSAVEVSGISEIGNLKTLWPLLILAVLMLCGHCFHRFLKDWQKSGKSPELKVLKQLSGEHSNIHTGEKSRNERDE